MDDTLINLVWCGVALMGVSVIALWKNNITFRIQDRRINAIHDMAMRYVDQHMQFTRNHYDDNLDDYWEILFNPLKWTYESCYPDAPMFKGLKSRY